LPRPRPAQPGVVCFPGAPCSFCERGGLPDSRATNETHYRSRKWKRFRAVCRVFRGVGRGRWASRNEPVGKVSGNFKNARNWRLETWAGVCFVQVKFVSNSGLWIRNEGRWGAVFRGRCVPGLGGLLYAAARIEFSLSTTLARCEAQR